MATLKTYKIFLFETKSLQPKSDGYSWSEMTYPIFLPIQYVESSEVKITETGVLLFHNGCYTTPVAAFKEWKYFKEATEEEVTASDEQP